MKRRAPTTLDNPMRKQHSIVGVLSRAIDDIRDEEMRADEERHNAAYAEERRRDQGLEERRVAAAEYTARALDQIASALQRISTTGIPGLHR